MLARLPTLASQAVCGFVDPAVLCIELFFTFSCLLKFLICLARVVYSLCSCIRFFSLTAVSCSVRLISLSILFFDGLFSTREDSTSCR